MFDDLNQAMSGLDPAFKQSRFDSVASILSAFVNLILGAALSISIIGLAYSFIQFTLVWGDPKNLKKARDSAIWSAVGVLISLMAIGIKATIFNAANVPDIQMTNSPDI